ncbi:hypothetical protein BN946_scf184915.g52 [Trametes cinnabarina]|uniref:Uncharacterized protein n=1 Tax=Pycnoporus cinnabarinus TaxID=5643 RepID=A0A060SH18_PYCCI|nr:hypothetical protein BN946_scf184915.g52 [Trametes cinnabarina]
MASHTVPSAHVMSETEPARLHGSLFYDNINPTSGGLHTAPSAPSLPRDSLTSAVIIPDSLRAAIQECVRSFLGDCAYSSHKSASEEQLRQWLALQTEKWKIRLSAAFLDKALNASCNYVETVYGHLPSDHRCYVSLYTLYMFYAEDIGQTHPECVMDFTRRFVRAEKQPDGVLECLAATLKRAYDLWSPFGADAIITGTLDALSANYIECTTQNLVIKQRATRLTCASGRVSVPCSPTSSSPIPGGTPRSRICKSFQKLTTGRLVPIENFFSDILSFYKEELAGERTNYVHLRVAAEQTSTENVLRKLVEEVSDTARRVKLVLADDIELLALWTKYMQASTLFPPAFSRSIGYAEARTLGQCYLEFHLKTPRYRLAELGFEA